MNSAANDGAVERLEAGNAIFHLCSRSFASLLLTIARFLDQVRTFIVVGANPHVLGVRSFYFILANFDRPKDVVLRTRMAPCLTTGLSSLLM